MITIKTISDFFRSIIGKFNSIISTIDPTIDASLAKASSISAAAAGVSLQEGIQDLQNQMFWQTQDDSFLEMTGQYDGTIRLQASQAFGNCCCEGTLNTVVTLGQSLSSSDGNAYTSNQEVICSAYTGAISSLTYSVGVVTAVTTLVHSLASGLTVTISGASQSYYNGSFKIVVLDKNTFQYNLTAGTLTSDTGVYADTFAIIPITSVNTGSLQNLLSGSQLTISLTGMTSPAYVDYNNIGSGIDLENINDYRANVGINHTIVPGLCTNSQIIYSAKSITGNTRVYLVNPLHGVIGGTRGSAGYYPQQGELMVYILRDNDVSIIPSSAILTATYNKIISGGNWPSMFAANNLFVIAPGISNVNFVFTALSPNTSTMQDSIKAQLKSFFRDNSDVSKGILLDTIRSFIYRIQDVTTGQFVTSYTMTSPSADISAVNGYMNILGTVTFP